MTSKPASMKALTVEDLREICTNRFLCWYREVATFENRLVVAGREMFCSLAVENGALGDGLHDKVE